MESGSVALVEVESDTSPYLFPMTGGGIAFTHARRHAGKKRFINSYTRVTACPHPEWINTGRQCRCGKFHFDGRMS
jgi:hypothetical protein